MLKVTVSGSFHRHMLSIYQAVGELRALGVDVLSPSDPTVVDHIGEFLFVASDRLRSIKLVQDRHLEAIRVSDFLLVVCPDGYTGASTSGEIMAASVMGVPVFSTSKPLDITIGQYVQKIPSIKALVDRLNGVPRAYVGAHVLIDPDHAVEKSIDALEGLRSTLTGRRGDKQGDAERSLEATRSLLTRTLR